MQWGFTNDFSRLVIPQLSQDCVCSLLTYMHIPSFPFACPWSWYVWKFINSFGNFCYLGYSCKTHSASCLFVCCLGRYFPHIHWKSSTFATCGFWREYFLKTNFFHLVDVEKSYRVYSKCRLLCKQFQQPMSFFLGIIIFSLFCVSCGSTNCNCKGMTIQCIFSCTGYC